jgi:hypothetical protein
MKKRINIILLTLVLGLWGTVIYKYVSQYFTKKDSFINNQNEVSINSSKIKEKDTFSLNLLNRDPFLNKSYYSENKPVVLKKTISTPKTNVKPIINNIPKAPFPNINYLGYIKSKEKKYELALLKINGKFQRLKINQEIDNIKLLSITKDSVRIKYFNDEKNISLK